MINDRPNPTSQRPVVDQNFDFWIKNTRSSSLQDVITKMNEIKSLSKMQTKTEEIRQKRSTARRSRNREVIIDAQRQEMFTDQQFSSPVKREKPAIDKE